MTKYYTTVDLAKKLGITQRGVIRQIKKGKYPNAKRCQCQWACWLIPELDVKKNGKK